VPDEAEEDAVSYEDRTKAELQDELRERELSVSGSKQDLIDRLNEADETDETDEADGAEAAVDETDTSDDRSDRDDTTGEDDISTDQDRSDGSGGRKRFKPLQLAQLAAKQLQQISGRPVNGVTGLERADEGWRVSVDLVEISRIPPSTDVLGSYEVVVDDDGDLLRYERIRRFIRGQAGEDMA
jgi:hypothetical protein